MTIRREMRAVPRAALAVGATVILVMGAAACSGPSASGHGTSTTAATLSTVAAGPPTSAAAAAIMAGDATTRHAHAAVIGLTFAISGAADTNSPTSVTGGTLQGPYSFDTNRGQFTMMVQGQLANTLGSSIQAVYASSKLYLAVPPAGSALSILAAGKPYVVVTTSGLASMVGFKLGSFGPVFSSDPSALFDLLDTNAMTATDAGTDTVNGSPANHYQATVPLAPAAAAAGPAQDLYKAIAQGAGPISSINFDAWIDSQGRIVRLTSTLPLPGSLAGPDGGTIRVDVQLSSFGTAVHVTVPPVSQTAPFGSTG